MAANKIKLEDKFKIIDVESTLKMLATADNLRPYQKEWVIKSYKNILDFKHQNDIL
jgi:hypothetical protein